MMEQKIQQKYGGLKIVWHHEKLRDLLEGKITAPVYIRMKPTNKCNHNCSFCSYDPLTGDTSVRDEMKNRKDEIPREKMLEILSDFKGMGVKAVTYSGGGEPLIYPYIEEAFEKTLEYEIDLSIITNGQKLDGKKAELLAQSKWVRISSDASDAETFTAIRKVPLSYFHELKNNIENFAKIKNKNCELGINFVVHKINHKQVYTSARYFKELGVNHIKITPMWISNFTEYHKDTKDSVIEQIEKAKSELGDNNFVVYDTYKNDFSHSSTNKREYAKCYIMQINPVIGANSKVYLCHDKAYAKDGCLGSIKDISFKELWFSEQSTRIFREFNPKVGCQHHCANDSKNLAIKGILESYGEHINFI